MVTARDFSTYTNHMKEVLLLQTVRVQGWLTSTCNGGNPGGSGWKRGAENCSFVKCNLYLFGSQKKKKLKNKIVLKNNHKLLNKMKLVVNKFILLRYDFINIAYTYICV